jgi:hypothetical protein
MDFESFDSSGTDDDLPPSHQNRIPPRGARVTGNGRSTVQYPPPRMMIYGETDMETQIHQLEQEAYIAVLRAFKAQADAITWEKESLITELRKELRLSNEEHRELLGKVNTDDVIRRIRDWRQVGQQGGIHEPVVVMPSPSSVSASRTKKQKILNQSTVQSTQSFPAGQNPNFRPQAALPVVVAAQSNHPSSSSGARRGGPIVPPKVKKHKSGQILGGASSSSMKMQQQQSSSGRGNLGNRVQSATEPPEKPAKFSPYIGRNVRTRWPDDNNFYQAVITDYNPAEGRHALVYDIGTINETWEWVNLEEISPEDIKWDGDDPGISRTSAYGGPSGRGINRPSVPGGGRGRGGPKAPPRKDLKPSQNGSIGKKRLEDFRLLNTDALIKEVERVFAVPDMDPIEIEKAKKAAKDHEQALADAIARLSEYSDAESGDEGGRF